MQVFLAVQVVDRIAELPDKDDPISPELLVLVFDQVVEPQSFDPFQHQVRLAHVGHAVLVRLGDVVVPEPFADLPLRGLLETLQFEEKFKLQGLKKPPEGEICEGLRHDNIAKTYEHGLTNLGELPERFTFAGFPLNFQGRDGSPIRAVAILP